MKIEYNKVTWYSILLAIVLYVGIFWLAYYLGNKCCALLNQQTAAPATTQTQKNTITSAMFNCDNNKTINALFFSEKAELTLSDGRSMLLMQAISASGARYANTDESFVFWNKGDTAFVTENGNTTFNNCVAAPSN
jgi:membrane-bound inhibitor of C-type lysozyme